MSDASGPIAFFLRTVLRSLAELERAVAHEMRPGREAALRELVQAAASIARARALLGIDEP